MSRRLALVACVTLGGCGKPAEPPTADRSAACKRLIDGLVQAVQRFDDRNGAYPPSGNAALVAALTRKGADGGACFTFAPETLDVQGLVVDPWGRPLLYINNLDGTAPAGWSRFEPFCVYSAGPDGRDEGGKGDDIASWK